MNREIKFRVWKNNNMSDAIDFGTLGKNEILCDTKDSVLMQYTGLKDKNCKEIYEGDIVEIKNVWAIGLGKWSHFIGKIIFFESEFQGKDENDNYVSLYRYKSRIEIIGNIYENPELLECQKI